MQCIWFTGEACCAHPQIQVLLGRYKPEDAVKKEYCTSEKFRDCPRYGAMLDYLKASKGQ